jgi:hypothetical protein
LARLARLARLAIFLARRESFIRAIRVWQVGGTKTVAESFTMFVTQCLEMF